jgi:hypothetical protein
MAATIPGYHSEEEHARRRGKSLRTIRLWRRLGIGSRWTKNGKTVLYPDDADVEDLKANERHPVRARRHQQLKRNPA